jgi:hypothetical protein
MFQSKYVRPKNCHDVEHCLRLPKASLQLPFKSPRLYDKEDSTSLVAQRHIEVSTSFNDHIHRFVLSLPTKRLKQSPLTGPM